MGKKSIRIIGTGAYLPERIITNDDMAKLVDTSDEWIVKRTGISTRHAAVNERTWEMGAYAAKKAIAASGLSPDEIDAVIASTVSNDYYTPSLACLAANEVGIKNAFCFDLNAACAGFVYAVDVARRFLLEDEYKNVLIISSEMLTKITDYEDRSSCILFGDGAGACVVTSAEGVYSSHCGSDTTSVGKVFARSAAPHSPFRAEGFDPMSDGFGGSPHCALWQDGPEVYKFASRIMPEAIEKACEKAGIAPSELKLIFPHQANRRIIEAGAKNLGIGMERFFVNIHKHGNMSSACIPICLDEALDEGRLARGDKVCIVGFGAGLTYGAAVFEW